MLGIICEYILEDDDGTSIRALGCISKHLRDVVLPFQYRTIQVHQEHPSQLLLWKLYEALILSNHSARVKHLCVTLHQSNHGPDPPSTNFPAPVPTDIVFRRQDLHFNWYQAATLVNILKHVAPTLETLVMILPECLAGPTTPPDPLQYFRAISNSLLELPCPRLRELSVLGEFQVPTEKQESQRIAANFPQLRYLSLMDTWEPAAMCLAPRLAVAFPNITHLHFGGKLLHTWPLALAMHTFLERSSDSTLLITEFVPPAGTADLPPALESLIVEADPADTIDGVEGMAWTVIQKGIRLSLKKGSLVKFNVREKTPYSVEDMKKIWLEGIRGDRSGWAIDESLHSLDPEMHDNGSDGEDEDSSDGSADEGD